MKNLLIIFICFLSFNSLCFGANSKDIKQQALALYATENYKEAYQLLDNMPFEDKNEEIFLILANCAESLNDDNLAIQNLNKALDKNFSYYKAYYNLGLILAKKQSYKTASDNFKLALKYNKDCLACYYNIANCEIKLEDYKSAKKNLIKALQIDPINKNCLYNLAYCYKKLNKEKQAKKIIDSLNRLS